MMPLTDDALAGRIALTPGVYDGNRYYGTSTPLQFPHEDTVGSWAQILVKDFERAAESVTQAGAVWLGQPQSWSLVWMTGVVFISETSTLYHPDLGDAPVAGPQVPAPHLDALRWIRAATGLPQERISCLIGVTRQALHSWETGRAITDAHRRRVLAVRDVLERAARTRPNAGLLAGWLDTPRGANGRTPAEALQEGDIDRARLLAVTSPDLGSRRPPSWADLPVPDAFHTGAETRQHAILPDGDQKLFVAFGEPGSDGADNEDGPSK